MAASSSKPQTVDTAAAGRARHLREQVAALVKETGPTGAKVPMQPDDPQARKRRAEAMRAETKAPIGGRKTSAGGESPKAFLQRRMQELARGGKPTSPRAKLDGRS